MTSIDATALVPCQPAAAWVPQLSAPAPLEPVELAYLVGGPERAVQVAIEILERRGIVAVHEHSEASLVVARRAEDGLGPLEAGVLTKIIEMSTFGGVPVWTVVDALKNGAEFGAVDEGLRNRGFLETRIVRLPLLCLLIMADLALLPLSLVFEQPVIVGLFLLGLERRPRPTWRGSRVVAAARLGRGSWEVRRALGRAPPGFERPKGE